MTKREARQQVIEGLASKGIEAVHGKGGFYLRGQGHVSFAQARKLSGADVPEELRREQREAILYGDAAIVRMIAGRI
jgi:hypothetical protein